MKRISTRLTAFLLAVALLLSCAACGGDKAEAATMKLTKTKGTVGVSDGEGRDVEPREDLGLYSGYQVETRAESYAWIELDRVKMTKLDESSAIEITKDGKMLEIDVVSGSLFFNITEPLSDDESLTIRTSTIAVGIRGTCGWVARDAVALLEGRVEVTAGEQSVTITAGEMAVMTEDGTLEVAELSAQDLPAFVRAEVEDDRVLMSAVFGDGPSSGPNDGTPGSPNDSAPSGPVFVSWADAGLADHVMDWRDEALAAKMAEVTGITDREIMLSDVWELRELEMEGAGVSDISALGELTNLTSLDLFGNGISDISALGTLTNLTVLLLWNNDISDISPLGGLTNLITLNLEHNGISDIDTLSRLTRLQHLELGYNDISDISALSSLTDLTLLYAWHNSISDLSPLSGLTELTLLYLDSNDITDISPLQGLTKLSQLGLPNNHIRDVSALSGMNSLVLLHLFSNEITDVSPLSGLTHLDSLTLSGNNITDYSPVEFVRNLSK